MLVGVVQSACSADKQENVEKALDAIKSAAKDGARIICLQELFATHYFCQHQDEALFELAEKIPGPFLKPFEKLAKKLEVVLIVPVFEERAPGLYHNSAAVIDADGSLLGVYRKTHIPQDTFFMEKFYFSPGQDGFKVWETRYGKIGVCICWDQWFPEAARATALLGAEILFYPTAIGNIPEDQETWKQQHDAWETMQRSHAIANGCFVAVPNRVGSEPGEEGSGGIRFWGKSFVCAPSGKVLERASGKREDILVVDCDLGEIRKQRQLWPFLRDRRYDAYSSLNQQWMGS